jgi:hypothetical protein
MSKNHPSPIETVDEVVREALHGNVPRRDFLRRLVLLGLTSSAAYKLLDETTAQAQTGGSSQITTFAIGEEGNAPATARPSPNPPSYSPSPNPPTYSPPQATTFAVGEESSAPPTTLAVGEEGQIGPTTMAVGEEQPKPYCPTPQTTTKAVGEESNPPATTRAVGEEGNPPGRPTTARVGEESTVTTRAVGEESTPGGRPSTLAVGEEGSPAPQPTSRPRITTQAIGEEGSRSDRGFKLPSNLRNAIPTPWRNFRRW